MAEAILALCLFHVVFFRRFYFGNPYWYATSSALDIQFSASRLLGDELRRGALVPNDPYFYPRISGIPFLSNFYPPHMMQAWVGSFLSLDHSWVLYCWGMMVHYLWASIGAYLLFSQCGPWLAFFGAITLTPFGYAVKQNSCINYTVAWIPWALWGAEIHNPWVMGGSLGMMTLAGYWPLGIYAWILSGLYWLSR
jgi:hypothetical protein